MGRLCGVKSIKFSYFESPVTVFQVQSQEYEDGSKNVFGQEWTGDVVD